MNGTVDLISSDLSADMKNSWRTDPVIFSALNKEFNFCLDVAASDDNHLCEEYYTKDLDALSHCWIDTVEDYNYRPVYINPPYGCGYIKRFMNKCIEQKEKGVISVMLVPATLDTQWLPIEHISEIRIITGGRLSFYHPITNKKVNGNTKGSMLVIFRPSKMPCTVRLINRDELLEAGTISQPESVANA